MSPSAGGSGEGVGNQGGKNVLIFKNTENKNM